MSFIQEKLSAEALLAKYHSADVQEKILDLLSLSKALSECVIRDEYSVSAAMNSALTHASEEGAAVRMTLMAPGGKGNPKPSKLTPPEVNLMNLLTLFHTELLLDVSKTDPKEIAEIIGEEVAEQRLLFPFQFGREIYDIFNQDQEEEVSHIDYEKSVSLLAASPIGVFHQRHFLFGPLGLIITKHSRTVAPRRDIYLQHSADRSYRAPHRVWLSSSSSAPVNRFRSLHTDALERNAESRSAWGGYFKAITISSSEDYNEESVRSMPYLLGDCLDDQELGILLDKLVKKFDYVGTSLRSSKRFVSDLAESDWTDSLDRAQKIQAILCANDSDIKSSLDQLILDHKIIIPTGEIRRTLLNGRRFVGQWGTHMEMSRLGTRVVSRFPRLPHLRLAATAERVFTECSPSYKANVLWKFRQYDKLDGFDRIREAIVNEGPRESVIKLFVEEREALERVSKALGFSLRDVEPDEHFTEIILWRLGLGIAGPKSQREIYTDALTLTLSSIPESTAQSGWVTSLRETTVDYFVQLEKYLKEILVFSTWTLTYDHYGALKPFAYSADEAQAFCSQQLNIENFEKLTLNPLIERFRSLVSLLKNLPSDEANLRRAESTYPEYADKTSLQDFPFRHTVAYLDLSSTSQAKLVETLKLATQDFFSSQIPTVRNGLLHQKEVTPSPEDVRKSLQTVNSAIRILEESGLTPAVSKYLGAETDTWGVTAHKFGRSPYPEITLSEPSLLGFARLPRLAQDQILVSGSEIQNSRESLRFEVGVRSRYSDYWDGFPVIPRSSDILAKRTDEAS